MGSGTGVSIGMISPDDFPNLTNTNHRITSPATTDYNCIAWATGDTTQWWEPGIYWPKPHQDGEYGIGILVELYAHLGYETCDNEALEPGFIKIALYGTTLFYTHAARQLPNGQWTSKLGKMEDIEHESPHSVAGGVYGEVVEIMKCAFP